VYREKEKLEKEKKIAQYILVELEKPIKV